VTEIAVLGSAANICARLSSKAAAGEILISEESARAGHLDLEGLETRSVELKGVSQEMLVRVMKV
jgi:class 3 adenylate cyclase